MAATPLELGPGELRRRCDPAGLGFATTETVPDLEGFLGQDRAAEALELGTSLRAHDFNIFALGPSGLGKHAFVRQVLEQHAAKRPVPRDWCYVQDFSADGSRPRALGLPAGRGIELKTQVAALVAELRVAIPRALESDEVRSQTKAIEQAEKKRREEAFKETEKAAEDAGVALIQTPTGMALAGSRQGEILGPQEFAKLSQEEKEHLTAAMDRIRGMIEKVLEQAPRWHHESHAAARKLAREAAARAVRHLVDECRERWKDVPDAVRFLGELENDVVENGEAFAAAAEDDDHEPKGKRRGGEHELSIYRRYKVNLVVDNSSLTAAPIVYEDHPTHVNLFGRVEHLSVLGALLTDFNMIKAGAIQRANGGYLVLDALKVLQQPWSWDALKRALRAKEVRIESPLEEMGYATTVSLEPEPIPLDLKVVLVGERRIYYLLSAADPDFSELWKVAADFEEDVAWTDANLPRYARLVATVARREKLRPLEAGAVARLVEEGSRLCEDRERTSLDLQHMSDLLRESDHRAAGEGKTAISPGHVAASLEARDRRLDRVRGVIQDELRRGMILVETKASRIGQVNALSVLTAGDFVFARPSRVTARAHVGRGEVVDIEREVELGGPIHSKGVLILQGFLTARYAAEIPLSLAATLVFEQSYGGVEGDSASLAELCALLSEIGQVPLKQALAVTGSVNQRGEVQPVGGLNAKVEGFYDTCRTLGLTGEQGVIVPRRNVPNLMLRGDVVEAVAAGRFHVYAIETVDECLELLSGKPAGERGLDETFPEGTFNSDVETRLAVFAASSRAFELPVDDETSEPKVPRHLITGDRVRLRRPPPARR